MITFFFIIVFFLFDLWIIVLSKKMLSAIILGHISLIYLRQPILGCETMGQQPTYRFPWRKVDIVSRLVISDSQMSWVTWSNRRGVGRGRFFSGNVRSKMIHLPPSKFPFGCPVIVDVVIVHTFYHDPFYDNFDFRHPLGDDFFCGNIAVVERCRRNAQYHVKIDSWRGIS